MSDNLGQARGSIVIDTSQLEAARAAVQAFATGANTTLTGINAGSNQAQAGLNASASAARSFAAAFGISFGAAGLVQLAKITTELSNNAAQAERTKEQYDVLAAGIGEDSDKMLQSMRDASKDMISDQNLIASANKGMMLEVVKNSNDLNRLLESSRVLGQAMGQDVSKSFDDVVTGLGRMSPRILDNLGIANEGEKMFENYALSVGKTADSLSNAEKQQVLMNRVLQAAAPLLEAESQRAEDQADKTDKLATSWENYRNQVGKSINTFGGVSTLTEMTTDALNAQTSILQTEVEWWNKLTGAMQNAIHTLHDWTGIPEAQQGPSSSAVPSWMTSVRPSTSAPLLPINTKDVNAAKLDWAKGILDLNQRTSEQLLQQNQDYQEQRANSEQQYQTTTLRAAEDFNLQRQREEQDLADSISRINRDAAEREQREAEDLARNIAQAESDSGERVAAAKKDANDRLAELDDNYEKDRQKRAQDLNDNLLDAAGDLDAKQVSEIQRNAARQEEEAKEAHDDQRKKVQDQLNERLGDEAKSLAKSIQQQRDTYQRQIDDGRAADAQRIEDMKVDLKKRQDQENADYGIRMDRMRQDHNDQLTEMDRQQAARLTQIQTHAQQERDQLDDEHKRTLDDLSDHNTQYYNAIVKADDEALKEFNRLTNPVRVWLKAPTQPLVVPNVPNLNNAYAVPGMSGGTSSSYSNSNSFSPTVNVNIAGGSNLTQKQIDDAVHDALIRVYQEIAQ